MKTQYRIVESRSGAAFDPFFNVEFREHGPGWLPFTTKWGNWIDLGSNDASGFGKSGLYRCKAWIIDQRKKTPDVYYSNKVVYSDQDNALSNAENALDEKIRNCK